VLRIRVHIALVCAGLDDSDAAFKWIGRAVAERSSFVVHLTWDARLEPPRADRRFAELVERLGIPTATRRAPARRSITLLPASTRWPGAASPARLSHDEQRRSCSARTACASASSGSS
jgi:hypothetical protein